MLNYPRFNDCMKHTGSEKGYELQSRHTRYRGEMRHRMVSLSSGHINLLNQDHISRLKSPLDSATPPSTLKLNQTKHSNDHSTNYENDTPLRLRNERSTLRLRSFYLAHDPNVVCGLPLAVDRDPTVVPRLDVLTVESVHAGIQQGGGGQGKTAEAPAGGGKSCFSRRWCIGVGERSVPSEGGM